MDKEKVKELLLKAVETVFTTSFYSLVEPILDQTPQIIETKEKIIYHSNVELRKDQTERIKIDLYFTPKFLEKITRDFLGLSEEEKVSNQDMLDISREIINMLAGEIARLASLWDEIWEINLPEAEIIKEVIVIKSGIYFGFSDMEGNIFHVVAENF